MTIPPKYAVPITKVLWLTIGEGLALAFLLGAIHNRSVGLGLISIGCAIFGVAWFIAPFSMTNDFQKESAAYAANPNPVADRLAIAGAAFIGLGMLLRWVT